MDVDRASRTTGGATVSLSAIPHVASAAPSRPLRCRQPHGEPRAKPLRPLPSVNVDFFDSIVNLAAVRLVVCASSPRLRRPGVTKRASPSCRVASLHPPPPPRLLCRLQDSRMRTLSEKERILVRISKRNEKLMVHEDEVQGQIANKDIPLENAYEESRRQNILQNMIIAAKLGILWNGTKSPHPKSLPRFFKRVMCRQKDDSVGQLLKKQLATAHVPNKDSERASDADIGRKEAGFGPIVLASNHLSGRLGSAHLDPPELNIKEKQVTAHVPAKQHCSTDVQSSSDANVCRNKTEGCGTGEAKIRRLQKDLDVATWRNKEMNRGWNSTIQDGLHAVADLQKLVAGNLVTALADADVHEINWTILEQVKARAETLHSSLQVDDFQRVMQEPLYE